MHAMLAYGDIDLVLAMNADTDTNSVNADIVINANADTAVIGLTADTAIDITADTYTARGQLHHLPLALHAVTSTRGVLTHPTSEGTRCWPMATPTWCCP